MERLPIADLQLTEEHVSTTKDKRFSLYCLGKLYEFEAPSAAHAQAWVQAIGALKVAIRGDFESEST